MLTVAGGVEEHEEQEPFQHCGRGSCMSLSLTNITLSCSPLIGGARRGLIRGDDVGMADRLTCTAYLDPLSW